jgi:hypothetical protein
MNAVAPVAPGVDNAIAVPSEQPGEISVVEQVVVLGDLARLTSAQRVEYYRRVCDSIGLNPLTRPFDYLILNGKLILYANKGASEQLRSKRGISIEKVEREAIEDLFVVTAYGRDRTGRVDSSIGAVPFDNLRGETKANAMMKAETKAKRRLTLSMAGLGMLDESEIDSINGAQRVDVDPETGEILRTAPPVRLVGGGAAASTVPERDPSRPPVTPLPPIPAGIGKETSLGHVVLDGTIEVNDKQRTDGQLRQGAHGSKLGFRFVVAGGGSVGQVIASAEIAEAIAERIEGEGPRLNGIFATVAGELFGVPWKKKNAETNQLEAMPPSKRLELERLWTPDWSVPPDQVPAGESPTDAPHEAAQDGVNPPAAAEPKQTTVADAAHEASKSAGPGMTLAALDKALDAGRVAHSFAAAEAQDRYQAAGRTPDEILGGLTDQQRLELAEHVGVLAEEE